MVQSLGCGLRALQWLPSNGKGKLPPATTFVSRGFAVHRGGTPCPGEEVSSWFDLIEDGAPGFSGTGSGSASMGNRGGAFLGILAIGLVAARRLGASRPSPNGQKAFSRGKAIFSKRSKSTRIRSHMLFRVGQTF